MTGTASAGVSTASAARAALSPIPFGRLLRAEARKLADTRGAAVLWAVMLAVAVAGIAARGVQDGPALYTLAGTAGIGFGTLLPVLAVLTVTAEWSHRTALTTFTLEPRRGRVMAAKFLPPLLAGALAPLFATLVAVPVTAVTAAMTGAPADWRIPVAALLGWTAASAVLVAQGLAAGTLLLNAPAAIVFCLASPMVWSLVGGLGAAGAALAGWLDLNATTDPLLSGHLSGGDAARLAVSLLAWIMAPMAAGLVRVRRKEVR
jgi:hypothetical protein